MLAFAGACMFLIITPGPGVLSVAGVGSGYGMHIGSRYLWGLCLGNIFVALAVVSGLSALVLSVPEIRNTLLVACVAYMLYLAAKVALAGSTVGFVQATRVPGIKDGVALQAINPKAYAANSLLFSGFGFLPENLSLEIMIKLVIWIGIWIPIHFAWLWCGVALGQLDLPPGQQRLINYLMAASMLLVVALAFFTR